MAELVIERRSLDVRAVDQIPSLPQLSIRSEWARLPQVRHALGIFGQQLRQIGGGEIQPPASRLRNS